jgi:uncharacterized protein (TIGR00645 family)
MTTPVVDKPNPVERFIFASRYVLVPMYLGLIAVQTAYAIKFVIECFTMLRGFLAMEENVLLVSALSLVDMVMIANLINMVIVGSQSSFVAELHVDPTAKPSWLKHISSGILKIKMGTSLIGVSVIHLLRSFIDADTVKWDTLEKQLWICGAFLLSSVVLAFIEYVTHLEHVRPKAADNGGQTH